MRRTLALAVTLLLLAGCAAAGAQTAAETLALAFGNVSGVGLTHWLRLTR